MVEEEIEQLVEGIKNENVDKFMEDIFNSQEDPDTRIEPMSDKETKKERKGNGIEESKDTTLPTPIRSPRTYISPLSMDKETLSRIYSNCQDASFILRLRENSRNLRWLRTIMALVGHLKKTFMPRKNFHELAAALQSTLKEVLPLMLIVESMRLQRRLSCYDVGVIRTS
ncbi:hypothetical protein Tco_0088556 [Tanacetum coccineum]